MRGAPGPARPITDVAEFQRRLRRASDAFLRARNEWHQEITAIFAQAQAAADEEPELFSGTAMAEQARLDRLVNAPINPTEKDA